MAGAGLYNRTHGELSHADLTFHPIEERKD